MIFHPYLSAVLFQNAKIQDLNVIHNLNAIVATTTRVVSECKDTRFECNSQLSEQSNLRIPVDTRSPIPVISVQSVGDLQYRWQS